jgi:prepilin-type N-terminal cleavage/methylation domain-containing protein/prepilin-type processing-associated H-X9-DG protein
VQKPDRFVHGRGWDNGVGLGTTNVLGISEEIMIPPPVAVCQIRRRAFTLIELLVVIAIIAVLAALLFPSLQGMINRSQSTRSTSNLRQIGAAVALYTTEHDGYFPFLNATHERTGFGTIYWPLQLENTVLNHPRKHAHDGTKHKILHDPTLPPEHTHVMSDYGGNPWIFLNAWGNQPYGELNRNPFRLINIRSPQKTIMAATAINPADGMGAWWLNYDYPTGGNTIAVADDRLSGGHVGAVFVDGHVETIPGHKLRDDLNYRRASFDPLYEP